LVEGEGLGFAASDLDGLAAALRRLQSDRDLRSRMSAVAREYFDRNHQLDNAMEAFENYFFDVHNQHYGGTHGG
jgi:glycosyltransferase involved in cell wall biosynthesis